MSATAEAACFVGVGAAAAWRRRCVGDGVLLRGAPARRRRAREARRQRTSMCAAASASSSSAPPTGRMLVKEVLAGDERRIGDELGYRLSIGERARTVAQTCGSGTLCTSSVKHGGVAFGSHVDYVLDEEGRPVLLLAAGAVHTANLRDNERVSLYCQPPAQGGQSGGRTTLVGTLRRASREELGELVVDAYLDTHAHAQEALRYTQGFEFYRMQLSDVYFVGGYGVAATWVDVPQYTVAEADPIAPYAAQLLHGFNDQHADGVLRLCTVFCGVPPPFSAAVVAVDRLGVDVRITERSGTRECRICFRERVANRFDAQSSIVKLLLEAWERDRGHGDDWDGADERPVVMYYTRATTADDSAAPPH